MRGWVLTGLTVALMVGPGGCGHEDQGTQTATPQQSAAALVPVDLALNWVAEPEFGGFYQALEGGEYRKRGLAVTILPGGPGAPVVQMVAVGKVAFGVVSADEIVIARGKGQDVAGVFAVYQTNPQGLMAHASLGLEQLRDVFRADLTVAMEPGLPYVKFLERTYGFGGARVVPYSGGVAAFLESQQFVQQCFVFSEPIVARRQGSDPEVFLIAESGYNPYAGVVAAPGSLVAQRPEVVRAFVEASREGWRQYLADPAPANAVMAKLNTTMDAATFAAAAEAQQPLVRPQGMLDEHLGSMKQTRWDELVGQLHALGLVDQPVQAGECFWPRQ